MRCLHTHASCRHKGCFVPRCGWHQVEALALQRVPERLLCLGCLPAGMQLRAQEMRCPLLLGAHMCYMHAHVCAHPCSHRHAHIHACIQAALLLSLGCPMPQFPHPTLLVM